MSELSFTVGESPDHLVEECLLKGDVRFAPGFNGLFQLFMVAFLVKSRQEELSPCEVAFLVTELCLVLRLVVHLVVFWVEHLLFVVALLREECAIVPIRDTVLFDDHVWTKRTRKRVNAKVQQGFLSGLG